MKLLELHIFMQVSAPAGGWGAAVSPLYTILLQGRGDMDIDAR